MRYGLVLILFLSVACTLPQVEQATSDAVAWTPQVDALLERVDGRLARTEEAALAAQTAVSEMRVAREVQGVDPDAPLSWSEWGLIGAAIVTGVLGLNTARDKKYKKT